MHIDYEKLIELRCRLQDSESKKWLTAHVIADYRDETYLSRPAKKKKRKKPKKTVIKIEDVSDGKL